MVRTKKISWQSLPRKKKKKAKKLLEKVVNTNYSKNKKGQNDTYIEHQDGDL